MKLKDIYLEDQKDRKDKVISSNFKLLSLRDEERIDRVREVLGGTKKLSKIELYYAAFVMHHGVSLSDAKRAIALSKRSMEMGYAKASWLYAASIDRYCMKRKVPQKYGTQYIRKSNTHPYELYKVDKTVTDSERKKLGVPTLKQAVENLKNFNK